MLHVGIRYVNAYTQLNRSMVTDFLYSHALTIIDKLDSDMEGKETC